jgi:ankyrin repeat protein
MGEERDALGDTELIRAVKAGALETVGRLLDQGADMEATDKWGRTSLIWAARESFAEIVALLLAKGAALDTMDMYGNTAWMCAAPPAGAPTAPRPFTQGTHSARAHPRAQPCVFAPPLSTAPPITPPASP